MPGALPAASPPSAADGGLAPTPDAPEEDAGSEPGREALRPSTFDGEGASQTLVACSEATPAYTDVTEPSVRCARRMKFLRGNGKIGRSNCAGADLPKGSDPPPSPMPEGNPIGGADAAEVALNGRVVSTVRSGGQDRTRTCDLYDVNVAL